MVFSVIAQESILTSKQVLLLLKVEVAKMGEEILDFKMFYNLMVKLSFQ